MNDGKSAAPSPDALTVVVAPPIEQTEASKAYHAKAQREQKKAAKLAEQTAQAQARYATNAKTFAEHDLVRPHEETAQSGTVVSVLAPVQIDKLPDYFEEVHGAAMALGADCRRCPLRLAGTGPVLHEIRPGAKMTVIGEAPGPTEVQVGRPNAGWSGNILNIAMSVGDIVREDTTMANVVMCSSVDDMSYSELMESFALNHKRACRQAKILKQPNPPPPLTPDIACRGALKTAIEQTGAPVLLTLGKQALESTTKAIGVPYDKEQHAVDGVYVASLAHQHGAPIWFPPEVSARAGGAKVMLAAYHPAYAARDKKEWLPAIMDVITRASKAASTDLAALAWNEFCEKCWIEPSIDEIIEFCRVALDRQLEVTVDIETDGPDRFRATLRLIQFAMMVDGVEWAINIPIRHMDGTSWWATPEEVERFKPWVVRVLDELPLAGQFLQYDTAVLLRSEGWMTNASKSWTDLTILYRATRDNDLPKNLAAIVSRLHPAPRWKKDVDFKSLDNIDDRHLLKYGIKDVIYEMRCLEPLRKRVNDCASWAPVEIDTALLPVWRDMGLLGLVVNEHERGQYSRTFNRAVAWLTTSFQNQVGRQINPNSVDQLQDLIFGEWEYRPVILPDGTELDDSTTAIWDDEELGSTSSQALIQLQKRRAVKPEHATAFETLLELRAYQKLRGTYTDNLNIYDEETEEWNRDMPRVPAVREMRLSADKDNVFKHWSEVECLPERGLFSRLLPVYLSHTIPTGRAASQGPNVQNIPAAGKANMRTMLVAPPGHVIVGADFDQLEARIYAALTGDKKILHAIKENLDIHSMNAATLLAKHESEFWPWYHKVADSNAALKKGDKDKGAFAKYWRTVAKRFAFLCIYGGEVDILWDVMSNARDRSDGKLSFPKLTLEDVIVWHERWHRDHPETREWHESSHDSMSETGYSIVPGLDCRKRWFPGGPSKVNAVPNMLVQGLAASIANRAMLAISEEIPFRSWSRWTGLSLQVHDYLQVYVPVGRYEEAMRIVNKCMPWEFRGVPITAEAQVSWTLAQQG